MDGMTLNIRGETVSVVGENAEAAVESIPFREWLTHLDWRFHVKHITFQSVDMVGSDDKRRVLFIKFKADVVDDRGRFIPGIVFMRGGSVGILVILNCKDEKYAALTLQPRFPAGSYAFPEIPAGMLDGAGNFSGIAAKELQEELGLSINERELQDMTELVYGKRWCGVYASPGGSDEFFRFFLYCKDISAQELYRLQGKRTGVAAEGEHITLVNFPLKDVPLFVPDAKTLSALCLYHYLQKGGRV